MAQTQIVIPSKRAGAAKDLGFCSGNETSGPNLLVRKPGYKAWERKIEITVVNIKLDAELEKAERA